MKKVFVLNDGGHNYDDAARFGEVVICIRGTVNRWDTAQMYRELTTALEDAEAGDYVLVSSLTTLCIVAAAILAERFAEIHLLLFKGGQYIERDIVLNN